MPDVATNTTAAKAPPVKRFSLDSIRNDGMGLPSRIILYGVSGIGKTSWSASAPKPIFIMSKLETGIISLKDAKLLPADVGYFPDEVTTWPDLFAALKELEEQDHDYKTVVFDVISGLERVCHEHVCERDYRGKVAAFTAYGNGPKIAASDWRQFLVAIDRLRIKRKIMPILLSHSKVKNFRNPEGSDYERYQPDVSDDTWSVTHGWADIVLFANYFTVVKENTGEKPKGMGGENRFLYTRRTVAWDAKNRDNLPEQIPMGSNGREAWHNFAAAMAAAKKQN